MEKKLIQGSQYFLMFRPYKDREKESAKALVFQTGGTETTENTTTEVVVKDNKGKTTKKTVVTGQTQTLEFSLIASNDEATLSLEKTSKSGELAEAWLIFYDPSVVDNKYKATYYQGILDGWELPFGAEDFVELNPTLNVNGLGKEGEVTLTDDQSDMIDYVFQDVKQVVAKQTLKKD